MKHLVIPDCQVKPGVPINHLTALGRFIVAKKPDVIVCIGDFADMESLSSYDVGKKSFEGRRYKADILASKIAMETLMAPITEYNLNARKNHERRYKPRKILTLGNHEHRIVRAVNDDPKLDGVLSIDDLDYERHGWEVLPYLAPITVDGVAYAHYFPSGQLGRPCTSARAILSRYHQSCVAGHQQGRDIAYGRRVDGRNITSIIAGSFYQHEEDYLNPFTNQHWRGVYVLHEVSDGSFDEMAVSLNYLLERYSSPHQDEQPMVNAAEIQDDE